MSRPIEVVQWADEATRSRERGCYWQAECEVDGVRYVARSRNGAPNELARKLLAAEIPDAPLRIVSRGWRGHVSIRSFHRAAEFTIVEGFDRPLHREKWREMPRLGHSFTPL